MNLEPSLRRSKGPPSYFFGDVWLEKIASPKAEGQRANVSRTRFSPGARTAWHSHAYGQTLHITQGVALVGARDGTIISARPGQTIYTPPGEEHWHGATVDEPMEHLAIHDTTVDPAAGTSWLEHVSEQDYRRHPATEPPDH